jgi:LysM repeat protein
VRRYTAPGAFLLAVTAAVLGIHYGLQQRHSPPVTPVAQTTVARHPHAKKHAPSRYTEVLRGDTFSSIAVRAHTTVAALERLNPGVSTTALRVGQKIRVH